MSVSGFEPQSTGQQPRGLTSRPLRLLCFSHQFRWLGFSLAFRDPDFIFCLNPLSLTVMIQFELSLDVKSWRHRLRHCSSLFLSLSMAHGLWSDAFLLVLPTWLNNPRCQPPVSLYLPEGLKAWEALVIQSVLSLALTLRVLSLFNSLSPRSSWQHSQLPFFCTRF